MPQVRRALARGAMLRCPACGRGRMSRAWWSLLHMHDACGACGLPFVPARGETVGGVEIAVYGSALAGLVSFLVVAPRLAWWGLLAWVLAFGALLPLAAYRHARGAWVGTMFAARPWGLTGDPPQRLPSDFPALPWDE